VGFFNPLLVFASDAASAGRDMQGRLSAVQQLAAEIGSAVVTTRPLQHRREYGGADAMTKSILVVVGIVAICLRLSWLPPRKGGVSPQDGT
jgi:hypothetical protein